MKSNTLIAALLTVALGAATHAAAWTSVPVGASAVPAASGVAAPATLGK